MNEGWIVDDDAILSETEGDEDEGGSRILKSASKRRDEIIMKVENRKRL